MNKFLLTTVLFLFFVICPVNSLLFSSQPLYPAAPDGYIYDGAGLINEADKLKLSKLLTILQDKTTAQVAVATVVSIQPETIESYAANLFSQWGVGQRNKNNGVLFLIARDDKELRIEVGYGLEGALPDIICKSIISNIVVPEFKNSNFSGGISKGVSAIVSLIAKEYNVAITGDEQTILNRVGASSQESEIIWLLLLFILVIFIFSFIYNGSSGSGGYRGGGYWYGGSSGGFGGGFGGGSSGGFGGFGGGMSGGGGASGGW